MESVNSSTSEQSDSVDSSSTAKSFVSEQWFNEQFETLLPKIEERLPGMAKQTLEATKGSLDELVRVISRHSGKTNFGVI